MAILVVIPKEEVTIQVKKPDQLKVTIREMFRTPEKVKISKKIMTPKIGQNTGRDTRRKDPDNKEIRYTRKTLHTKKFIQRPLKSYKVPRPAKIRGVPNQVRKGNERPPKGK